MKIDYSNSLINLINSITAKFGLIPRHETLDVNILGKKFEQAERVVLLLVDALGYESALKIFEENEELNVFGRPHKLSTVFPSTTVAALTTVATAALPIEHGMLGYVLYLKEYGTLANMIEFTPLGMPRDSLVSRGANPSTFLEIPTVYEDLKNYGANPLVITANSFKESGLSKTLNHNAAVQGYITKTDMMTRIRKAVESQKYSYIYAYWPMVDAMGHVYGPDSEEYIQEAKDTLLNFKRNVFERLSDALREKTSFIIVADHGQMKANWKNDWIISPYDEFAETLEMLPAGEPRMMYLYTKDFERTMKAGLDFFKGNVDFYPSKMAVEEGMFGDVNDLSLSKNALNRIGDLLAIPKGDHSFTIKYLGNERHLKGKHGGFSKAEMEIPLFSF
ncbi:alkaline phosphatase family protein [Mesoaciditoga lauensis]|uniref:alkaline phosphatase family protein n=1 Tax=Mesoaciditoga lauensis TaxID=1495039 RepID=UPI00055DED27|nr:alkaline phosphatase family protein [Mesoaciditoga lauensis]